MVMVAMLLFDKGIAMKESLDVAIGCEGRIFDKRSCSLEELGATVQSMVDDVVKRDSAFDEIAIGWTIDEDLVEDRELESA